MLQSHHDESHVTADLQHIDHHQRRHWRVVVSGYVEPEQVAGQLQGRVWLRHHEGVPLHADVRRRHQGVRAVEVCVVMLWYHTITTIHCAWLAGWMDVKSPPSYEALSHRTRWHGDVCLPCSHSICGDTFQTSGRPHAHGWPLPSAQESDEKWDQARSLTAQAQEQSRIAQTKSASASATERESNEAMRRADIARGQIQDIEVCLYPGRSISLLLRCLLDMHCL